MDNSTFRSMILRMSYTAAGRKEIDFYDRFLRHDEKSFDELRHEQNLQLRKLIDYVFQQIPYYQRIFKEIGITPFDISTVEDLSKLPILTKQEIRDHYQEFIPKDGHLNFENHKTGGSTGLALTYRVSEDCFTRGNALQYRGWGLAGYRLGDSISFFAGGSLVAKKRTVWALVVDATRNVHQTSCFGISEEDLAQYVRKLSIIRPRFIRGYPTSILILANYIEANGGLEKLQISPPAAIFTTAEMLFDNHRRYMERVLNTRVFNQYGLNDGGISAYEDGRQNGMLIDTERAFFECVDRFGENRLRTEGRILATSLYNYDFPFIRYDTSDLGVIDDSYIQEGGNRMLLTKLSGRTTDVLKVNGRFVSGVMLAAPISETDVLRFQIIHRQDDSIELRIARGASYNDEQEAFIRKSYLSNLGAIELNIFYDKDFIEGHNKHKFVLREGSETRGNY